MTMTKQAVISYVQSAILVAAPALKSAPLFPTDKGLSNKTVNTYADNLAFGTMGGFVLKFFDIKIEVMIPRVDLSDAMQFLDPIPELIAKIFTDDPTIGGHCQTYNGEVTAKIVTSVINGKAAIGWEITVPRVKI